MRLGVDLLPHLIVIEERKMRSSVGQSLEDAVMREEQGRGDHDMKQQIPIERRHHH